jgi:hypothetical protein
MPAARRMQRRGHVQNVRYVGSAMLSNVSASNSCGPSRSRRTTAARSSTQRLPQTERSTRRTAANSATPRSVSPTCGTTESSTSLETRDGWASP